LFCLGIGKPQLIAPSEINISIV